MKSLASVIISSFLLTGCSSTLMPLSGSVYNIEVKIDNPSPDQTYNLLSNYDDLIDSAAADTNGLVNFDISKSKLQRNKCYAVTVNNNKLIPIAKDSYEFANPTFDAYVYAYEQTNLIQRNIAKNKELLVEEHNSISKHKGELDSHLANKNGECKLLGVAELPVVPKDECYQIKDCEKHEDILGVATEGLLSLYYGRNIAKILTPMISTEYAHSLIKYNKCVEDAKSACHLSYIEKVKSLPEKYRQECINLKQQITHSEESIADIKTKQKNLKQAEVAASGQLNKLSKEKSPLNIVHCAW